MVPDTDPIVITGMGAVSPLGIGVETNWRALMESRSGIVMNGPTPIMLVMLSAVA